MCSHVSFPTDIVEGEEVSMYVEKEGEGEGIVIMEGSSDSEDEEEEGSEVSHSIALVHTKCHFK